MAKKIEVLLIDDIDGGEATGTVEFSLDGKSYEIDLNDGNAQRLRDGLAEFIASARKGGGATRKTSTSVRTTDTRQRSADIRTWAKGQGIRVNERGRIPARVAERYDAAH